MIRMCKKCENITKDTAVIYYLLNGDGEKVFFLGCGDSYYDQVIDYCPYCGRKLEEE